MLQTVCYGFIYLFEVLACYLFFENFYYRKRKLLVCVIINILSFAFQFGMNFISIRYINLITFIISTFLITLICYEAKLKTIVFTTALLTLFMFVSELIVIYLSAFLFDINLAEYENNLLVLIVQASLSKLLFFVVIFFIAKIQKQRMYRERIDKFTFLLAILPLTSLVIFCAMFYWGTKNSDTSSFNFLLTICTILLLFANIFIFYIYEAIQRTNYENLQLQLERQYTDISADFYEALSREYDNSRILIHDIKRHLNYIADKTADGEPQEVLKYISSVTGEFGLYDRIKYSGYQIVDAMINRYVHFCKRDGIKLEIEPLMTGLTFMLDSDVIALLGNLFDNAVEAAIKADEPRIMIGIHHASEKITVIRVSNTCKKPPKAILGKLITSKLFNKNNHGIGTQSIMRVVEKYDGDFRWEYDKETKIFTAAVFVQDTGVKK